MTASYMAAMEKAGAMCAALDGFLGGRKLPHETLMIFVPHVRYVGEGPDADCVPVVLLVWKGVYGGRHYGQIVELSEVNAEIVDDSLVMTGETINNIVAAGQVS